MTHWILIGVAIYLLMLTLLIWGWSRLPLWTDPVISEGSHCGGSSRCSCTPVWNPPDRNRKESS
jgi:hypothetical protein